MFSHNYKPEAIKVGDKKDIEDTRQFLKDLRAEIFAEMAKGTDPEAVPATLKLSKYKDWVHYDDWLAMNAWAILLQEFMGPYYIITPKKIKPQKKWGSTFFFHG